MRGCSPPCKSRDTSEPWCFNLKLPLKALWTRPPDSFAGFIFNFQHLIPIHLSQSYKKASFSTMKYNTILLALASMVLAAPADLSPKRQDLTATTDQLLFSVTLPQFEARRNSKNPATLDWSSDGCTSSPDNPFGFPFLPACHRHDFGYQNYRIQKRFTKAGKTKIDSNFKKDLYSQCQFTSAKTACDRLADVYHIAVMLLGGRDANKRDETKPLYDEAVKAYNKAVKEAQAEGLLPTLEY